MYAIKVETTKVLCRGCLSTDRKLSPLTNYELYFILLGTKQSLEDFKYINILLCWECHALLRKTHAFRCRLQYAQYTLSQAQDKQISTRILSTLDYIHKKDYDYIIEETIESKSNVEQSVLHNEIDIKEEIVDDYEPDYSETFQDLKPNNKDDNFKPAYSKTHQKKKTNEKAKTKRKIYVEKKPLQKIKTEVDLTNTNCYFSQVCLSEMEVDELLAKERDDSDLSRPSKCKACGFRFGTEKELNIHRKNLHKRLRVAGKCRYCALKYKTYWEQEVHCWRSHPVHRCSICGWVVARGKEKKIHLERHKYKYRCTGCEVDFDNKHSYMYHEQQLHSKYICDQCGNVKTSKRSMETHILRRHLPSKCPDCPQTFATWGLMSRHARNAHARAGDARYCVECDRTFASRLRYTRHLSQSVRHKPRKKISVPCPECGKVFTRKIYMTNHRKLVHFNESRHHCPLCDKYFVNPYSVRVHHKAVHQKIPLPKTKMCSVCGRGFGTNRVLENHMRTHTGERPFACEHCSAAFAQRVALKAHLAAIHKVK